MVYLKFPLFLLLTFYFAVVSKAGGGKTVQNSNIIYYKEDCQAHIPEKVDDLTNYLPKQYVKDGSVDYTQYIQRGLQNVRICKMPDFPILINESGLKLMSNSTIYFQPNSLIIMKPNSSKVYAAIWITNSENIQIENLRISGDRKMHKLNEGEWGMGVHIMNSKNVNIKNPDISYCWGDGIYVGGGNEPCKDITIRGARIDNCRRNGISITNGNNVNISNTTISNTNGTPPMAGICIEPNNEKNTIDNIHIDRVYTYYNSNYGIMIFLNKIFSANIEKSVNIYIDEHSDQGSKFALCLVSENKNNRKINGQIKINNPYWKDNKEYIKVVGKSFYSPSVIISNIRTSPLKKQLNMQGKDVLRKKVSHKNITIL